MIKVIVPATSANLAVGFDCIGLAVDMQSTFTFEVNNHQHLSIDGCPTEFQNESNLVYQAFKKLCEQIDQTVPDIHITIQSDVPVSRGLGSSATCIVGGLAGANQWFNAPLSNHQLLEIATEMEGHPDNVAPAILGGLCMAFVDSNQEVQVIKYPVSNQLEFLAIIPDFKVSTADARSVLPKQMSYADVTHQVSHSLLMTSALSTGNLDQLHEAMDDRMHEPFRAQLIEPFNQVKALCERLNAVLYISGSGSTLMAITDNDQNRNQLMKKLHQQFPKWRIQPVQVDPDGVKVDKEAIENR
ncbi:homoserine kinase [Lactobacillaceae bacterium Melli_B4]